MLSMTNKEFNDRINLAFKVLDHEETGKEKAIYTQKAFEKRKIVINASLSQIDDYGVEDWKRNFKRIVANCHEGFDENFSASVTLGTREQNAFLQSTLNMISPNLKLFQELFCDPLEFIDRYQGESKKEDIFACIVSPDRLPDKLLKDLRLCDLSKSKLSVEEKLEMKSSLLVTKAIKHIFYNLNKLSYLGRGYYSLGKVETSDKKLEEFLKSYNEKMVGRVVVISNNARKGELFDIQGAGKVVFDKKNIAVFASPQHIARSHMHVQENYNAEKDEIAILVSEVDDVIKKARSWNKNCSKEEKDKIKKEIQKACQTISERLSKKINGYKNEAKAMLESIDAQTSPMPILLKLHATLKRIQERTQECDDILKVRLRNEEKIQKTLAVLENKLDKAFRFLPSKKEEILDFFKLPLLAKQERLSFFNQALDDVAKTNLLPYKNMALKIRVHIKKANEILKSNSGEASDKQVLSEIFALKLMQGVEKFIYRENAKSLSKDIDDDILSIEIKKNLEIAKSYLERGFGRNQKFMLEYEKSYAVVSSALDSMIAKITSKAQTRNTIKETLEEFDVNKFIQEYF